MPPEQQSNPFLQPEEQPQPNGIDWVKPDTSGFGNIKTGRDTAEGANMSQEIGLEDVSADVDNIVRTILSQAQFKGEVDLVAIQNMLLDKAKDFEALSKNREEIIAALQDELTQKGLVESIDTAKSGGSEIFMAQIDPKTTERNIEIKSIVDKVMGEIPNTTSIDKEKVESLLTRHANKMKDDKMTTQQIEVALIKALRESLQRALGK